jgi:hypothetical protein
MENAIATNVASSIKGMINDPVAFSRTEFETNPTHLVSSI